MFNLQDCTFAIPIRLDCNERRQNLNIILGFLTYYFNTNIIVCESDQVSNFHYVAKSHIYLLDYTKDLMLHRTRLLNCMANKCTTRFFINYDVDVIVPPHTLYELITRLRANEAKWGYSFDGRFMEIPRPEAIHFSNEKYDLGIFNKDWSMLNENSVGGCVVFDLTTFRQGGGENENFKAWGFEDTERKIRFNKLGFPEIRAQGPLYHLWHPRGFNSGPTDQYSKANENELEKVKQLTALQLKEYISTWTWPR